MYNALFSILMLCSRALSAQTDPESLIRALEQQEAVAVLKGDTNALYQKLWAPEFVVNNPANVVVSKKDITLLIRSGKLDYEDFARIIEKITIVNQTAIVMGREEIKPQGVTDHAGAKLTRRFTNVWLKRNGTWQLIGRQATVSAIR
ncbi:nuclear transport factor 2 family protein [Dyadobacter crusticola]|uniref:nuclear transport factor 2 family protein n=1 Tax=Dyadobacter crusticola TaxID=292407 RepID=UPI0004E1750D|nr:nuclear transport factor 2 family protein [Dyadobacter crusticola]